MPSTFLQGSLQICDLHNYALGGGGELAAGEVGPEQPNKRRGRCNCVLRMTSQAMVGHEREREGSPAAVVMADSDGGAWRGGGFSGTSACEFQGTGTRIVCPTCQRLGIRAPPVGAQLRGPPVGAQVAMCS